MVKRIFIFFFDENLILLNDGCEIRQDFLPEEGHRTDHDGLFFYP